MTAYQGEPIAEFVARMRAEHGLPPKCDDPAVLGRIARELIDSKRMWFEAGRKAHRDLHLPPPPPSFYAALARMVHEDRHNC
jgi:hypothetical protein